MPFCRSCGAEMRDGASFCPMCGAPAHRDRLELVSVEVSPSDRYGDSRRAVTEVYRLNGIPSVTWYTERDERVCDYCRRRHGKRYRLDRVPEPHPRCRCALLPDTESENGRMR